MKFALKPIGGLLLCALLSACSGGSDTTPQTRYYMLNNQQPVVAKTADVPVVEVKLLELPGYLQQPNLVLQMADHQLHYARFDMWAEPLQDGLIKALTGDLNRVVKGRRFVVAGQPSPDVDSHWIIKIDHFHADSDSKVVMAGEYWQQSKKGERGHSTPFSLQRRLNQDGYGHSVVQMRALVEDLSQVLSSRAR